MFVFIMLWRTLCNCNIGASYVGIYIASAYCMPRHDGIDLAYCIHHASIYGMYLAIAQFVPTMLNGIRIMSIIHILYGIHSVNTIHILYVVHTLSTIYMLNGIHSMTRVHTMTVVYSITHVHVMNSVHYPSPWGG